MESKVTISESRFDELKLAEKELKETKYQLDCERQKLETATGLLRTKCEEVQILKKKVETECDKCPAVKERDELRSKLCEMTKYRDECESQFQFKCDELFHTIAECNELKSNLAALDMSNTRLQCKVSKLLKENDELKKRLNGDCETCVSQDEAKFLGNRLKEAEDCIKKAFEAWTQEDGTDKSYNKIGEILRKYIESMKKRGGNANG